MRKQIRAGTDPVFARQDAKRQAAAASRDTFTAMAWEWLGQQTFAPATKTKTTILLKRYIEPTIGGMPIADIEPPHLFSALRAIEQRGILETAHRVRQICGQVFRYAIATSRAKRDPSADLRRTMKAVQTTHFPAVLDIKKLGGLLRAIEGYEGTANVRVALQVHPYLFVRPSELLHAEWKEVDIKAAVWRIPETKTKMRKELLVPLAPRVVTLLKGLKERTGEGRWLFPSVRPSPRPLSNTTMNAAFRRMGYPHEEVTSHGFRATARTMLHEQLGFPPDVIELQLGHRVPGALGDTYARAQHWPARVKMMAAWATFLDGLKADRRRRRAGRA